MNQDQTINMTRKPSSYDELNTITESDMKQIIGRHPVFNLRVETFEELDGFVGDHRFWIVHIDDADHDVFVDASGYNYPRYASKIEWNKEVIE